MRFFHHSVIMDELKEPRLQDFEFFLYLERIPRTKKLLGEYPHSLQSYATCSDELSLSKLGEA
ncbi:hypothetical protein ASG81_13195 [Paenibacillus sp. Soil522]|nr:hypothetical protein ASG81_13195 [Paenibacillus sp. Soil522]